MDRGAGAEGREQGDATGKSTAGANVRKDGAYNVDRAVWGSYCEARPGTRDARSRRAKRARETGARNGQACGHSMWTGAGGG